MSAKRIDGWMGASNWAAALLVGGRRPHAVSVWRDPPHDGKDDAVTVVPTEHYDALVKASALAMRAISDLYGSHLHRSFGGCQAYDRVRGDEVLDELRSALADS